MSPEEYSFRSTMNYVLRNAWAHNRSLITLSVSVSLLTTVVSLIGMWFPQSLVKLVLSPQEPFQYVSILSLALLWGLCSLLLPIFHQKLFCAQIMHRLTYSVQYDEKRMTCSFSELENQDAQRLARRAQMAIENNASGTEAIARAMQEISAGFFCFVSCCVVIGTKGLGLAFVIMAAALAEFFCRRSAWQAARKLKNPLALVQRQRRYIRRQLKNLPCEKDIRVYRMKPWVESVYHQIEKRAGTLYGYLARTEAGRDRRLSWIALARDSLIYGSFLYQASRGLSIVDVTLLLSATFVCSQVLSRWNESWIEWMNANEEVNDLRTYLETDFSKMPPIPPDQKACDAAESWSLTFDHVWFRYAKDSPWILQDFCLSIQTGEKVAFVGRNGSGKSTLIKLALGMYPPERGRVYVGQWDAASLPAEMRKALFSAVFQESQVLAFSILENVSLKSPEKTDRLRVQDCLEKAGLWRKINALPCRESTVIGRIFADDGIDLSGGEKQKLLIARALYQDTPLLVLDEPTASLDPIAEEAIYQKYHDSTAGKTVLFVSHRLASTGFCDRIFFLENGSIVETGSHEQLMRLQKRYYKLFLLQGKYYYEGSEGAS